MSDASGSSDADLAAELAGAFGTETDQGTEVTEPVVQQEAPRLSAFATTYLETVPQEERDLVARHVAQWDRGFNKYAERVAKTYGQYDQLGNFEELQQAVTVARLIANDPHAATQWLIEQGYGPQQAAQTVQNAQVQAGQVPQVPQQPGQQPQQQPGIPPELQQELSQYKMALGAMYQRFEADQMQRETERYTKEIEAGLEAAKQKYGNIPETLVLHLMRGGMELDAAVEAVASQVQQALINVQRHGLRMYSARHHYLRRRLKVRRK